MPLIRDRQSNKISSHCPGAVLEPLEQPLVSARQANCPRAPRLVKPA